ncbi:MAG: ISKra4 family transposase [Nitrososphaera sp.]
MIADELKILQENAQKSFTAIQTYIEGEALTQELHEIEQQLCRLLQRLGLNLLEQAVARRGTGKTSEPVYGPDSQPLPYQGIETVRYLSIFGELKIRRAYYWEHNRQGVLPLDAELNLPEKKFSYLLQQWTQSLAVEMPYEKATAHVAAWLELPLHHQSVEQVALQTATAVDAFYQEQPVPKPETEGSHLAVSADGKGVRIRKAERAPQKDKVRRGKGEKRGTKKEAVVTADFSFNPLARTPEEATKALLNTFTDEERQAAKETRRERRQKALEAPRVALNKHVRATLDGQDQAFEYLAQRVKKRDPNGEKKVIVLVDGAHRLEKGLSAVFKEQQLEQQIDAIILDPYHVTEYLWKAGNGLYGEKEPQRLPWVESHLLTIMQGQAGHVIDDLEQTITQKKLKGARRQALQSAITYFTNHQHMMRYDEYLAKGYPIATGIVEGACGSLVKNRMEQSGMRWSVAGATAMLDERAVKCNGDWQPFWTYHLNREKARLYADGYQTALAA